MIKKFKVLNSKKVVDGFFKVYKEKIKLPDENIIDFYSVQIKEVVSVLALTKDKKILMCKQYRHPIGQIIDDLPAGLVEKGEDLESAARRELEEETGYTAKKIRKLGTFYPTAGISNMKVHYFLATGLKKEKNQKLDPAEFIDVKLVPLEELKKKILNNEHKDLPSSFGLLLYQLLEKVK